MKIYPSDVDAVVERFEHAIDVCTFALDDEIYGQTVGIAVVLRNRDDATVCALHQWMKLHLAEHKLPSRWWIVEEIPRTSRGKINRDVVNAACVNLPPLDLPGILGRGRGV
jgi:acyl-CoA synthetase (AMP-forming)/AMP-acid ligase II